MSAAPDYDLMKTRDGYVIEVRRRGMFSWSVKVTTPSRTPAQPLGEPPRPPVPTRSRTNTTITYGGALNWARGIISQWRCLPINLDPLERFQPTPRRVDW